MKSNVLNTNNHATSDYHPKEELASAIMHGMGIVFAVVMLFLMLTKHQATGEGLSTAQTVGIAVYGLSLLFMFLSSTLYHIFANTPAKTWLKRLDHCAIFWLIAGTYTPLLLIALNTHKAIVLLWVLWTIAILGTVFKLFFIYRFKRLSLLMYVGMGLLSVVVIGDFYRVLSPPAINLINAGGALYLIGVFFYVAKGRLYTHAIWHCFVLIAAACQAVAILKYVI